MSDHHARRTRRVPRGNHSSTSVLATRTIRRRSIRRLCAPILYRARRATVRARRRRMTRHSSIPGQKRFARRRRLRRDATGHVVAASRIALRAEPRRDPPDRDARVVVFAVRFERTGTGIVKKKRVPTSAPPRRRRARQLVDVARQRSPLGRGRRCSLARAVSTANDVAPFSRASASALARASCNETRVTRSPRGAPPRRPARARIRRNLGVVRLGDGVRGGAEARVPRSLLRHGLGDPRARRLLRRGRAGAVRQVRGRARARLLARLGERRGGIGSRSTNATPRSLGGALGDAATAVAASRAAARSKCSTRRRSASRSRWTSRRADVVGGSVRASSFSFRCASTRLASDVSPPSPWLAS